LFTLGHRCGVAGGAPRGVDEGRRLGRRAPEEARQGNERLRVGDGLCLLLGRRRRGQEPKPWLAHPMAFQQSCANYADIGNSTGSRHPGQRLSRDEKTYRAALSATNAACTSSRNAFERSTPLES